MNFVKTVVLLVALLLVFLFAALSVNQEEVRLSFALWQTPMALSVFWWLLAAFLIGLVFGVSNALWLNAKHRLRIRKLNQSLNKAEAEVARLSTPATE